MQSFEGSDVALVNAGHMTPTLCNCYFSEPGGGVNAGGETQRPIVFISEILQSSL
jgi:hypothetical protein